MNLIIAPHCDDEFGCFSYLKDSYVVYVAIDESKVKDRDPKHRIGITNKMKEIENVAKSVGFKFEVLPHKTYHLDFQLLVYELETIINDKKPDTILIPSNKGTNIDHRLVHEVCLVALRNHDKNFWVKNVLVYEDLQPILNMEVEYFKEVNITEKMKAFELYESQMRPYRNSLTFYTLNKIRGVQSNTDFAEGFEVLRICQE